jgi:signal transduction histidine kinase/ligand-binding sensor domain-containing protein
MKHGVGMTRYLAGTGLAGILLLWLAAGSVRAERLPITRFDTEQGLASEWVRSAVEDRQGFIWFGTGAGLSRFDGQNFRSFGRERGLETTAIHDLLAQDDGTLLVGTSGGLYLFDPAGGGRYTRIRSDTPTGNYRTFLLRTRDGTIWVGSNGLYRLEKDANGSILRRMQVPHPEVDTEILDLIEARDGGLWVASKGVYRVSPDMKATLTCASTGDESSWFTWLAEDGGGRIWTTGVRGPMLVEGGVGPAGAPQACRHVALPDAGCEGGRLLAGRGENLWAGCSEGVFEIQATRGVVRAVKRAQGLHDRYGAPMLVDTQGNLWIGSDVAGIARLAPEGFTSFGVPEGLEEPRSAGIEQTRSGELVQFGSAHVIHRYDGTRFHAVRPRLPDSIHDRGWGWRQFDMQDHQGDWWIPTGDGIVRYAAVKRLEDLASAHPKAVYAEADGLPSRKVFRLFEDSRGDVWVSMFWPDVVTPTETLARWDRSTGRFQRYGEAQGVTQRITPTAFLEVGDDASLWIGYFEGYLYRHRKGVFQRLLADERIGAGIVGMRRDHRGRIWIATADRGVLRVDDPHADEPSCVRLTTHEGLTTDLVNDVTEDDRGRIYIATDDGVDILENDRVVQHLGPAEGLPSRHVSIATFMPGQGIWFGTTNGLARLDAANEYEPAGAPRTRIDALRVGDVQRPLSALGESKITDLVLSPDERRLQIDFLALGARTGGPVRFQYRMEAGDAWSEPTPERTVLLPNLTPGRYRFEVRAAGLGVESFAEPAVVSFQVLAPFWRRAWFIGLVCLTGLGLAALVYRARVGHLLALERQRTRIAMDLHDEMGSGLGSIGVLADLASEDSVDDLRRRELLDQVASTASELGASMSDIVTSLRPGADTLEALARHLSERGRRMFPGRSPQLEIRLPEVWPSSRLTPAVRHNVALIALEALHNAARHANARNVKVSLERADGSRWRLSIEDDGRGVASNGSDHAGGGLGLESMRRRAALVGADFTLRMTPEQGTLVTLLFDPAAEDRRVTPGRWRLI